MNVHNRDADAKTAAGATAFADRLQRMLRHKLLILTGLVLAISGVVAFTFYVQSQPVTLKFAVGPRSSEDYRLIQTLAQYLARERAPIRLSVVRQDGSAESAEAIDANQADLAIVRRDLAMPKNGQVVAIYRRNIVALLVPQAPESKAADSKSAATKSKAKAKAPAKGATAKAEEPKSIEAIGDLAGKTIAVIGRSTANVMLLNTILSQYGVAPDQVTVLQFASEDLTAQLRAAKFDALLTVGPVGSKLTAEAIAAVTRGKEPPKFLEIASSEAIEQQHPVYESTEIPSGAFGGSRPEEAVETIGFSHYIVARRGLDDRTAGDFTRVLFDAKQALGGDLPAFTKIERPDTEKGANLAVHPGTLAYLEGEQKTFFERYSEPMYWGLMLLSFAGSGAAWLASYARASHSSSDRNDLELLIGLVKRARAAKSASELDVMRAEIDAIVERTIRGIEAGALDANRTAALKLATEQARNAISEQKSALKV